MVINPKCLVFKPVSASILKERFALQLFVRSRTGKARQLQTTPMVFHFYRSRESKTRTCTKELINVKEYLYGTCCLPNTGVYPVFHITF